MDLRDYEQDKFAIADILRSASIIAPKEERNFQERLRDLFVRLAEDRFNLVVVGRFNRGKTSIMNAIMGSDRLPVGIVPLTSVITTVSYGTTEQVVLKYRNSLLNQQAPIDALPQYVTQEGNPGNVRGIKMAEVQLRAEILRRGFYFVDTPGLGSAIIENTRTTEAFLPEADAFLVVTSYESALTEEEIGFLRSAFSSARRIFVVLNKHDTVSAEQRDTVLNYVRDQLHAIFGETTPRLFSVSANEGLDAKRSQDLSRLSTSGILALEEALVGFLLTEKKDQFLLQMCRRTADLIRTLPPSPQAVGLTGQTSALFERLTRNNPSAVVNHAPPQGQEVEPPSLQQLHPCEICTHVNDALWDFECKYQYDISVDHRLQRIFVASGGLCSFHTWQYHAMASPYGICNAYPTLLDHLARWFRTAAGSPQQNESRTKLQPPLATPGNCMLCDVRAKAESEAISKLAHRFSKQGLQTLNALSAVCIPHLVILSGALQDTELVRKLMDHQATLLERLSEDMKRFALKHNAMRRDLETKEEVMVAERALLLVAGHRNVTASGT
jgi:GTP-binding protein EngB required for normal cell division